jgi:hypothetical protein
MQIRTALTVLAVAAFAGIGTARGDVTIPSPKTTDHPGAKQAPASSPLTYTDEAGFEKRAQQVIDGLKDEDLSKWRRGYFSGGDPGKYLPGAAMAKLLADHDLQSVRKYMNDDRSYKEHYHFAAVNWARVYPIWGEASIDEGGILTDQTREQLGERAGRYGAYTSPSGTENHKTMWWTSTVVLPDLLPGDRFGQRGDAAAEQRGKQMLRDYVKGLYTAGAGEWDSSTYTMFTMNGLMNIYDFSDDPEARRLAKAGLDLLASSYALKYTDGVFTAPNQRGFADGPVETIADDTGYVWWGTNKDITAEDMSNARYALHAITSGWRPNEVISNIATKDLPGLPVEQRNTKGNYWHGMGQQPKAGNYHETLYLSDHATIGSLWDGHTSQLTRFQIAVPSAEGGQVFSGGHPRKSDHTGKKTGIGYADGTGRYLQSAQVGPTYMALAVAPEDEEHQYTYFRFPSDLSPQRMGDWYVFGVGQAIVAARPLTDAAAEVTEVEQKRDTVKMLQFPGRVSGFIVEVMPKASAGQVARKLQSTQLTGKVEQDQRFTYRNTEGEKIDFQFNPDPNGDMHGERLAKVSVDGEAIDYDSWDVFGGPFVHLEDQVLTVNDGRDGFVVDFSGDQPVYKPWKK